MNICGTLSYTMEISSVVGDRLARVLALGSDVCLDAPREAGESVTGVALSCLGLSTL